MTTDATTSPLRHNGIYRFKDQEYTAVHLSTPDQPWRSTGLMVWSTEAGGPKDIIYLRHEDGVLIGYQDFAPIGTLADLVDTGRGGAEIPNHNDSCDVLYNTAADCSCEV